MSAAVDISRKLHWVATTEALPPDPVGGWFSPMIWLAFSDGRVLPGSCLHASANATHGEPIHDWFAIDADGNSKSLNCFGNNLTILAWMPFAIPDHPTPNMQPLLERTEP